MSKKSNAAGVAMRSKRSLAQRWLIACAFGVLFTGVSVAKGNWAPAVVLGALTIFAGAIGGWNWRRARA